MLYIKLFLQYASQYIKTKLEYRGDFIVGLLSDLSLQAVNLIFILVVFGHTQALKGWSREEVIFIYGFFLVPFAIFSAFFNIWDFNDRYIIKGEMDRVLTRPIHSLFQIILERMELESLIGAFTGIIVMSYAAVELQLSFYWYDFFLFLLMVGGGALVYGGIFVTLASLGFWSDAKSSIMPLMYNIGNYGRYPVNIYNRVIRFILTFVLPFAFVGVYPAAYFLRKTEWNSYAFATPIVGIICFTVAITLWNQGVKRYRGAGN